MAIKNKDKKGGSYLTFYRGRSLFTATASSLRTIRTTTNGQNSLMTGEYMTPNCGRENTCTAVTIDVFFSYSDGATAKGSITVATRAVYKKN